MTRRLLVVRPQPGSGETVHAALAMGFEAVAAPLFTIRAIDWIAPDPRPQALLLTSANGVHHGGEALATLRALPVYAVGAATANAARAAGFTSIVTGGNGIDAIIARAHADGVASLLHLAGREHHLPARPPMPIDRRIVYTADATDRLPEVARAALPEAVTLLHSARAAGTFARLIDGSGIPRAILRIVAISEAARAGAGAGWRATAIAAGPTDAALLAVAAELCDQ
jgi:uroporphyrinogen-III synthase